MLGAEFPKCAVIMAFGNLNVIKKSRLEDFVQIRGGSPFGQDGVEFDVLMAKLFCVI